MSAHAHAQISFEEYLEVDRRAEFKSEFINGKIVAMAGASWSHGTIVHNLGRGLGNQVLGGPCRIRANDIRVNDIRVKVNERYGFFPDVLGLCCEPQFAHDQKDTLLNPELVIEVLSPSTELFDRGNKRDLYQSIPTLKEYLLVSQTRPHIEHYTRQTEALWQFRFYSNLDDLVAFSSMNCSLSMREIYAEVEFTEEAGI